jgi:hypothetical protein
MDNIMMMEAETMVVVVTMVEETTAAAISRPTEFQSPDGFPGLVSTQLVVALVTLSQRRG